MFTDDRNPEQKWRENAWCAEHVPPVVLSMKKALTVPSGNCGKAAFLLCRGWKHGRMSSSKSLRGDLLRGLGHKGGGWGGGVTKGVVGLLHSLGLKKRTCRIPKKLLHTERFSASPCIYFLLSAEQLGGQLGSGSTCGCERDGLWKGRPQWESRCSSSKEQRMGGTIGGSATITSNLARTFESSVTMISARVL